MFQYWKKHAAPSLNHGGSDACPVKKCSRWWVNSCWVVSNGNAIVTAVFPANQRGQALGILGGTVGIGLATGPVLGGVLVELLDWRAIFLVRLPLSLAVTALLWRVLQETPAAGRDRGLDVLGSLALFDAPDELAPGGIVTRGQRDGDAFILEGEKRFAADAEPAAALTDRRARMLPVLEPQAAREQVEPC